MTADYQIVFEADHRQPCLELRMVLLAAGISAQAVRTGKKWTLRVFAHDLSAAVREIEAYIAEQEESPKATVSRPSSRGKMTGLVFYVVVLSFFSFIASTSSAEALLSVGSTNAGKMMDGEWYRAVTALTLHQDFGHLLSNLIFGVLFGFLASEMLGGGLGWLLILLGGAMGNALNAVLREATHVSIGASTAVFAALGIAVSQALWASFKTDEPLVKKWSPLIGGVLLLAFLGIGGENTDVGAHFTGFFSGVVLGGAALYLPKQLNRNTGAQLACGAGAIVCLAACWGVALLHIG